MATLGKNAGGLRVGRSALDNRFKLGSRLLDEADGHEHVPLVR